MPVACFGLLYVFHVRPTLASQLMDDALGPGGWLSGWLIDSPESAWRNFVAFQNFLVPPELRVRMALLLLGAVAVSLATGARHVAILTGSAFAMALVASVLGLYPLGESRHNVWLTVFAMPTTGWLAGRLAVVVGPRTRSGTRMAALAGWGAVLLLFAGGGALETRLGGPQAGGEPFPTTATVARVLSRDYLAPLVVSKLDPAGEPRLVVMTEQTYNVLMPLYASQRQDLELSPDSTLFHFRYGNRDAVVERRWDWTGVPHVADVLRRIPEAFPGLSWDGSETVLLLAGGWGSSLLVQAPELVSEGVVTDPMWALGPDHTGELTVRLGAMPVDPRALMRRVGEVDP